MPQALVFEVTVTDDDGGTDTDTVEVSVAQTKLIEVSQSNGLGPLGLLLLLYLIRQKCRRRFAH